MTLSVGHHLKQTNPDGSPVDTSNYVEHTYKVTGIYGMSGYASEKQTLQEIGQIMTNPTLTEEAKVSYAGSMHPKTYLIVVKVLE